MSIKANIIEVINQHYNSSEKSELIERFSDQAIIPITKLEFRNSLYEVVKDFSTEDVLSQINNVLETSGYSPLQ